MTSSSPSSVLTIHPSFGRHFTALDRCDRCAGRAKFLIVLPSNLELQFCGHHASAHKDALIAAGAEVIELAQS